MDPCTCRHLSFALRKRRSGASTRTTHLISQQSTADPSVTFFKLEDPNSFPGSNPESGLGPLASWLASPVRRSKRVKVEIVNTERTACCGGDDDGLPGLATKAPTGKGEGQGCKTTTNTNTVVRICSVAKGPQSNQAGSLEGPSHTCALVGNVRRHQGCARGSPRQWTPWLRHGQVEGDGSSGARRVSLARVPNFSTDPLLPLNVRYRPSSSFFVFGEGSMSDSRCSIHLCSRPKPRTR